MANLPAHLANAPTDLPPNTCPLPRSGQLAGLLTSIRDKNTNRGDFIFYSDRIIRLLVEEGA
jgi:uracil phosphoribosyltransferase